MGEIVEQVKKMADVIRREVRLSAGIQEGQEFQCDWERVAESAIREVRDDRVEYVATYDELPDEGSSIVSYFVNDEGAFYEFVEPADGSSGWYRESG